MRLPRLARTSTRVLGLAVGVIVATTTLSACGSSTAGSSGSSSGHKPDIVATTNVWGDIARTIAGNHATVTSLIHDPNQDPHSFESSTRTALLVKKASLIIENGGGYDDFMTKLRTSTNTKAKVVNAVDISGFRAKNGELNEHVWYDFAVVQKVAGRITDALVKADDAHAVTFRANLKAFDANVAKLIARTTQLKKSVSGKTIAITEPVPLYLTDALGLVNRTPAKFSEAIEEGDDMSPAVLAQTLKLFSDKSVDALVYNEQTTGQLTVKVKQAATAADIPVVPVTETVPTGENYLLWMQSNLNHLDAALTR